ncbi:MAG TPA: N-formylglutamate amidohydrolase [Dongiaceae bacterium]|nr:N-formylglutamate amidohydrolase [Dongiaceae bacterium]
MRYTIPEVLVRYDPETDEATQAPLVLDSPHSGSIYPADFRFAAPFALLRRAEDAFVDELFAGAPRHGATLLAALFPRSYIDPNRHEAEIDPSLLAEPWPHPVRATRRSARGRGLVRRLVGPDQPVYDRRLSAAEVAARIGRCHRPYHAELAGLLDRAHRRFGAVWHLDCHSMRATGWARGRGSPRDDFVLGDRHGTTCDPGFTELVRRTLTGLGYGVAVNRPFKGAEVVRRHGRPAANRHSLQIEVNRRLYMDQGRIEKTAGFDRLKADIDRLIAAVADYARAAAGR